MDNANDYAAQRKSGHALLGVSLAPWLNVVIWTVAALTIRHYLSLHPQWAWEDAPWSVFLLCCPLVLLSSVLLLFSIPIWYLLFFKRVAHWKDGTAWRADVVYCLGWAVNFILVWADHNHFLRWFFDQMQFMKYVGSN